MSLLYRPNQQEALSLARLAQSRDGAALMDILKAELQVTSKMLESADEEKVFRRLQGRALLANGLMDALTAARKKEAPL